MIRKQRGLTAISWVIILALVAIQGIFAMRVIPIYLDFNNVKKVMNALPADNTLKNKNPKQIRDIVNKRLKINNMYELAKNKDAIIFSKIKNGYRLTLDYEQRGPIYKNLEFVATFHHEVDVITQ